MSRFHNITRLSTSLLHKGAFMLCGVLCVNTLVLADEMCRVPTLNDMQIEDGTFKFYANDKEDDDKKDGGGGEYRDDDKLLEITTDTLNPFKYESFHYFLKELDSIDVRISNECKNNICKTKAYNKETGKLVYETNCKDGELHGKQYMSFGDPDDYFFKREVVLYYKDGKLHGKQQVKVPWYEAKFSITNDKLHGKYEEIHAHYNTWIHSILNVVNGVATGDYEKSEHYIGPGDFKRIMQGQYDSSGNLSGTQIDIFGNHDGMNNVTTHEIKIISCENNECKVYATYTGKQSGEAFGRGNKLYEAFHAKRDSKGKFPRDLKVLIQIMGDKIFEREI
ncbi:hypothetical protein [Helicobacter bilis]|nr:hypothetical protein [Helicobacter bilis]